MEGWIKIHRKIQENWLWQEKRKFSKFEAWMSLLLKASHKGNKLLFGNDIIDIKAGSFITSEVKLADEWNWSRNTVRKFLTLLEKEKMLKKFCTTKYTIISIEKWAFYQFDEQQIEQQTEQQKDINLNTIKNVKNVKKEEEEKEEDIFLATADENYIKFYMQNINPLITPYEAEMLNSYSEDLDNGLMIQAMKDAIEHKARNFAYIKKILDRYVNQGIKTKEQLDNLKSLEEKPKDNQTGITFREEDLTPEQLDAYLSNKMTKEELKKILEAKDDV